MFEIFRIHVSSVHLILHLIVELSDNNNAYIFILLLNLFLLIAAKCTPSLVNEMNDCRAAVGEKAKFKIQFAGNPRPGIFIFPLQSITKNVKKFLGS